MQCQLHAVFIITAAAGALTVRACACARLLSCAAGALTVRACACARLLSCDLGSFNLHSIFRR